MRILSFRKKKRELFPDEFFNFGVEELVYLLNLFTLSAECQKLAFIIYHISKVERSGNRNQLNIELHLSRSAA